MKYLEEVVPMISLILLLFSHIIFLLFIKDQRTARTSGRPSVKGSDRPLIPSLNIADVVCLIVGLFVNFGAGFRFG